MKTKLVCIFAFFTASIFAQEKFEKGYYLDTAKRKVDCFIKITDLESLNEKDAVLRYRNDMEGGTSQVSLESIIEVGIDNDVKLHRYDVEIDDSNYHQVKTSVKYPVYEKKKLFLNVLIEGKASLLSVDNGNGIKYFYRFEANPIQLIYKKYQESDIIVPRENVTFRQQLTNDVSCEGDSFDKFSKLSYEKNALLKIFEQYNACHGVTSTMLKNEKKGRWKTYFGVNAGAQLLSASIENIYPDPDDESKVNYLLGGEMELRNASEKWGLLVRVEFEMMDVMFQTIVAATPIRNKTTYTYEIKNLSTNLSFSGRFYFNPEAKNKIFTDVGIGFSIPKGNLDYEQRVENGNEVLFSEKREYPFDASAFGNVALGYIFSNHFGIEIKGNFGRKLMNVSQNIATIKCSAIGANFKYIL